MTDNGPILVNRRGLLKSGAVTLALVSMGSFSLPALAQQYTQDQLDAFLKLSMFVTNHQDINPAISARSYGFLMQIDPSFDSKVIALNAAIKNAASPNIDVFLPTASRLEPALQDAMTAIVSCYYLGVSPTLADGHPGFITFIDALMYEPTDDALNRPSYAHEGLDYWVNPPAGTTIPPMPANIKQWGQLSPKGQGNIPGALADGTLLRRPVGLDAPLIPTGNEPGTE